MNKVLIALGALLFACAASAVGLKAWITQRIEAAAVHTALCLSPDDRAKLSFGTAQLADKDLLVEKAAMLVYEESSVPTGSVRAKGIAIRVGYPLLWSAQSRAAIFDGLYPHLPACADPVPRA